MIWNKDSIQALLDKSDKAVGRALTAIYALQTADEKASGATKHENSVGFSAFDAEFCSSLARQVNKGWQLSPKQMAMARNKMKRYHRQLVEIANAKPAAQAVESDAGNIEEARLAAYETGNDCQCENMDGEGICSACQDKVDAMQRREAEEEASRMRYKFQREDKIVW